LQGPRTSRVEEWTNVAWCRSVPTTATPAPARQSTERSGPTWKPPAYFAWSGSSPCSPARPACSRTGPRRRRGPRPIPFAAANSRRASESVKGEWSDSYASAPRGRSAPKELPRRPKVGGAGASRPHGARGSWGADSYRDRKTGNDWPHRREQGCWRPDECAEWPPIIFAGISTRGKGERPRGPFASFRCSARGAETRRTADDASSGLGAIGVPDQGAASIAGGLWCWSRRREAAGNRAAECSGWDPRCRSHDTDLP